MVNKPYVVINFKKHTTKYGDRIVTELDGVNKLYLPERYKTFREKQLQELRGGRYVLINKGLEGKSYKLEFKPFEASTLNTVSTRKSTN